MACTSCLVGRFFQAPQDQRSMLRMCRVDKILVTSMGNQLAVNPNETAVPPSQLKANQDGKMSCCCTTSACIEHMIVSCYMSLS